MTGLHSLPARTRVVLLGVVALLYLVAVVIGIRVHATAGPLRVDARTTHVLNSSRVNALLVRHHLGRLHSPRFLGRLADLGDPLAVVGLAVVLAAVAARRRDRPGLLLCTFGPLAAVVLTEYLAKPVVDRMIGVHGPVYPSGHVTGASAVAMVAVALAFRYHGRRAALLIAPIAALLPTLVAWGVIGRYYHYATDTVGGGAVGIATVLLTALVLDMAERRAVAPS